jgi:hypothetical protein
VIVNNNNKNESELTMKSAEYQPEPRIYRIIRIRFSGNNRTIRNNVTLTEAQAHCSRKDTSSHATGPGAWFDAYDYMRGCAPKGN